MPVSSNVRRPQIAPSTIMNISFQIQSKDKAEFLQHWASKYRDPNEKKYLSNIDKSLTNESLQELFEWKNGSIISTTKLRSITENYPLSFKGDPAERYLNHKKPGGAIWNIFFLHCLNPKKWPIFDQHSYRAMRYLKTSNITEIGNTNRLKYVAYQCEYIPFFKEFSSSNSRQIDMALFSFGQFLKLAKRYA